MNSSSISRPDARDAKLRRKGSKHTPGPWMVAAGPSSVVGWPVVARPAGRSICNVSWLPGLPPAVEAEVRANGLLIAAAPELLAALKMAEEYITSDQADDPAPSDFLLSLRAAIAKAEGQ